MDENFVFSYRNALEVASRFELDHRLSAWHSSYIQSLNDWKSSSLNELFNVNYAQLTETRDKMMSNLNNEKLNPTFGFDTQQEIMKYFFEDHKNFEIFCQWKSKTDSFFRNKREMFTSKIEKEFDVVYNLQKTKKKMDENFVKSRKDIISKVLTFFTEMKKKGESLTDPAQMDEKFNTIWKKWRSNIYFEKFENCNISNDLQNSILESDVIKPLRVLSDKKDLLKDPDNFIAIGSDEFKHLSFSQTNDQSYYFINSVHRRDNELATIAVGLGDVTLVNMFGEGHNEVTFSEHIASSTLYFTIVVKLSQLLRTYNNNSYPKQV